jgi:hypothetical protein
MKFFTIPKNAAPKALLASGLIYSIFAMAMIELCRRDGLDWQMVYSSWASKLMIFGGFALVILGLVAYRFPRAASLMGVVLYAAFIVLQFYRGIFMGLFVLNIPMVFLLIGGLACAFRAVTTCPPGNP